MWTNHSFEGFKQGYKKALKDIEQIVKLMRIKNNEIYSKEYDEITDEKCKMAWNHAINEVIGQIRKLKGDIDDKQTC